MRTSCTYACCKSTHTLSSVMVPISSIVIMSSSAVFYHKRHQFSYNYVWVSAWYTFRVKYCSVLLIILNQYLSVQLIKSYIFTLLWVMTSFSDFSDVDTNSSNSFHKYLIQTWKESLWMLNKETRKDISDIDNRTGKRCTCLMRINTRMNGINTDTYLPR